MPETAAADALAEQLRQAGWRIAAACACSNLVREAVRVAPLGVVVQAPQADAALLAELALLQQARALPVLLFAPPAVDVMPTAEAIEAAGVGHWVADPCTTGRLAVALPVARALHARLQALRQELAGAQSRLDERKWVDRAKGVLMSARHLSEPDAFALLRTASMQANLRVGEVSRAVIEAAEAADAVNRAGQLRMLSQRLVKALALVQLGVERGAAEAQLQESADRAQGIVDRLGNLPLDDAALAWRQATAAAWQALHAAIRDGGAEVDLAAVDDRAGHLLDQAERLTDTLQQLSGRRSLQVVNLAGRQRMLSQRVAKQSLLAGCLSGPAGDAAAAAAMASVAEFDAALTQLERSPLAGDEIRATLAVARGQWQRLLEGVRGASAREGRITLARESEALLQSFERLTSLYEHSMQVLLG
jgi:AmiR/NasT family two-component response regulator